jgi:hypothetical protein
VLHFDHFLSYTNADNIDDYLKLYETYGFIPNEKTVKHSEGRRNGFISMGTEYIEFLWVEDEELFEREATEGAQAVRNTPCMIAIGILGKNLEKSRESWIAKDFDVTEINYVRPRGADPESEPVWAFLPPPDEDYGVNLFSLSYLTRTGNQKTAVIHPNKIFGITGITMVTDEIEERMTTWIDVFECQQIDESTLALGDHFIRFLTPAEFKERYNLDFTGVVELELGLLHLLSTDLEVTANAFKKGGRDCWMVDDELIVPSGGSDGFVFSVTEANLDEWKKKKEETLNVIITIEDKSI